MPCKRLVKPLLLAAAVLLNLAGEVFAHSVFAGWSSHTIEQHHGYQALVTLRWGRTFQPNNVYLNWCWGKDTLPSNLQPANQGPLILSTGNYCKNTPGNYNHGLDITSKSGGNSANAQGRFVGIYNTKWIVTITNWSTDDCIAPFCSYHGHTIVYLANIGPNRPPQYGGENDARRNQSRSFRENPAPNTAIGGHVRSYSDPDGDTQHYTLSGPDAGKFTIGLTDGIIRTKGDTVYDYDKGQRIYSLTVEAADRKTHLGNADTRIDDTASVTLSLTNYTGRETPSVRQMTAGPTNNAIRLSWNKYVQEANKPPFSGYQVRIKQGETFLATRGVTLINTTSYTRTGLTNGTTYSIWVEACNHEGCSGNPVGGRAFVTPAAAGVAVTRASPFRINEGGSKSYTLALRNRPAGPVVIAVSRKSGSADLTAAPPRLTFTPLTWNTPQTVTVSAAEDNSDGKDENAVFGHTISGDTEYTALSVADFTASAIDDDVVFGALSAIPNQSHVTGSAITPLTLPAADAGSGSNLSYTLTPPLPAGLSFNPATRVLSGVPMAAAPAATYTYTAADNGNRVTLSFTITVERAQPTLSVADVSVTEGDASTTSMVFTVRLSEASVLGVTVSYEASDVTALPGEDFIRARGTLTFAPGETTKTVVVPVIGDARLEEDETIDFNLSNAVNTVNDGSFARGTIINDDTATFKISAGQTAGVTMVSILEGERATFCVYTDARPQVDGNLVLVQTSEGTATSGTDYTAIQQPLDFFAKTQICVPVQTTTDTEAEGSEIFTVGLTPASGPYRNRVRIGTPSVATARIVEPVETVRMRLRVFLEGPLQ